MKRVRKWVISLLLCLILCLGTQSFTTQAATVYTPAAITKQPENYYGEYGSTITFSLEASATAGMPLYYQWFYRPANTSYWLKSTGATGNTISAVFYKGMDNWEVACLVSDGRVLLSSDIVTINYGSKPQETIPDTTETEEEDQTVTEITDPAAPEDPFVEDIPEEEIEEAEKDDTIIDEVIPEEEVSQLPGEDDPENEVIEIPEEIVSASEGSESSEAGTSSEGVSGSQQENTSSTEISGNTGENASSTGANGNAGESASSAEGSQTSAENMTEDSAAEDSTAEAVDENRDYVTPEQFGAKGDGVTDDAAAIQAAVDSGKDVVFSDEKTYFISADKYISINNKTDFRMSGGNIHKEASPSNYNLFVIKGCTDCVFENMYIYSEFTCTDITVPNGHSRPTNLCSNVLAFSGLKNKNISFINNSFDYMSGDYWLNGNMSGSWENVTVDGWTSHTSMMPMYAQFITGLSITNADLSMNPTYAGNGDHCIYMCTKASGIRISDSVFSWYGDRATSGTVAVLTFHGGSASAGTMPQDIVVSNCTVNSGYGKTVYTGEGVTVNLQGCELGYAADSSATGLGVLCGYGSYELSDSTLSGYDTLVDVRGTATLNNCIMYGASKNGIFGTAANVSCTGCDITIINGSLYYVSSGTGVNHSYVNCAIRKNAVGSGYVLSKRSTAGNIYFEGCSIDCGRGMFMYNGGRVSMSGVSLVNSTLTNCAKLGVTAELSGLTASGSTVNGSGI